MIHSRMGFSCSKFFWCSYKYLHVQPLFTHVILPQPAAALFSEKLITSSTQKRVHTTLVSGTSNNSEPAGNLWIVGANSEVACCCLPSKLFRCHFGEIEAGE